MPRPTETLDIKGVTTYNSMLALDGSKKLFCIGCGGPRDVKLAETVPCFCCGSLGTQKTQPVFDEFDELVPAEVVAAQREKANQERTARLVASNQARAARAAAPVEQPAKPKAATTRRTPEQAITQDYPESDAAKAIKLVQKIQQTKPSAKERKQAAASTLASLF